MDLAMFSKNIEKFGDTIWMVGFLTDTILGHRKMKNG